jgi:excisionase family DNA binding protein
MPAQKKKYRNPLIEFPAPKPITTAAITPQFLDINQAALKDPARTVEAARYLGVSKKTLLKYCSQHLITFMRYPDGSFRFRKAALDLFMAK